MLMIAEVGGGVSNKRSMKCYIPKRTPNTGGITMIEAAVRKHYFVKIILGVEDHKMA